MPDQPDPVDRLDALRHVRVTRDRVAELERDVTELRAALILAARDAGASWREIGGVFDVSPQRAHEMSQTPSKENPK